MFPPIDPGLQRMVASRSMGTAGRGKLHHRLNTLTFMRRMQATWMKAATGGKTLRQRRLTRYGDKPPQPTLAGRLAINQPLCIRMTRLRKYLAFIPGFTQSSAVHHRNTVAGLRHDTEIVGDQNDGNAQPVSQV